MPVKRGLLAVLAGASAGVALVALPGAAAPAVGGGRPGQGPPGTSEAQALDLLSRAVRAGRDLRFSATQHDAAWRGSWSGSVVTDVRHDQAGSWRLSSAATGPAVAAVARLDARLLRLLAASYDLAVVAPGTCAGRATSVVEARRAGVLAGRLWIDAATGLLLRREVLDGAGRPSRDSTVVELDVEGNPSLLAAPVPFPEPVGELPARAVAALRSDGWTVPESLPEGFGLFDARLIAPEPGAQVLHLSYSDGLSTLSLFAQHGGLGAQAPAGFTAGWRGDRQVWTRQDAPERVVWDGGGEVWTLVSDAPPGAVTAAVAALARQLPRQEQPPQGVLSRIGRGLARMTGMLNPFR